MRVTSPKQAELMHKLLIVASGNLDLVREAIHASVDHGTRKADLSAVVKYIVERVHNTPKPQQEAMDELVAQAQELGLGY